MEEELHSFPYDAKIGGTDHHYRITQNHEKYGIEQDGVVIAEVVHGEQWEQLTPRRSARNYSIASAIISRRITGKL